SKLVSRKTVRCGCRKDCCLILARNRSGSGGADRSVARKSTTIGDRVACDLPPKFALRWRAKGARTRDARPAVARSPEQTLQNDCSRKRRRREHPRVVARFSG